MTYCSKVPCSVNLVVGLPLSSSHFNEGLEVKQLDSNRRIENLDNWASGHSGPSGIYRLKHEIWTWKKDPGNKQIAMEQ